MRKTLNTIFISCLFIILLVEGISRAQIAVRYGGAIKPATAAGFSPLDHAGCKLWLEGDKITGETDGNALGTWTDSSSTGNTLSQSTTGQKPLYKSGANGINSLPVVRFDGSDDNMTGSATGFPTGAAARTAFIVFKTASTGSTKVAWGYGALSTNNAWVFLIDASDKIGIGRYANDLVSSGTLATGTAVLLTAIENGSGTLELWRNGTSQGTASATAANTTSGGHIAGMLAGNQLYWNGDVALVLFYDSAFNSTDRATWESFYISKYAIP